MGTRRRCHKTVLEELKTDRKVVGLKQLRKALGAGSTKKIFVALDADPALTEPIIAQCAASGIAVVWVPTMKQLGEACNISVAAAVAAII